MKVGQSRKVPSNPKNEGKKQIDEKKYTIMMNINIQCLATKINQVEYILRNRPNTDVVCIIEHWMTEETIKVLNLPNYRVSAYYCRTTYSHGGVLILTKNSICARELDLTICTKEKSIELCSVVIPKLKSIVIAVYHPPYKDEEFIEQMEQALNYIKQTQTYKNIFIMGDFNICTNENSAVKEDFLALMSENGLHPIFNQPSRVSGRRCIDNMFVDKFLQVYEPKTTNFHLGDHLAQEASFILGSEKKETKLVTTRIINDKTIGFFENLLQGEDWTPLIEENLDAQSSYTLFHTLFTNCFNRAFPEVTFRKSKSDNLLLRWETKELDQMKNQLDAIYTIIKVTEEYQFKELYKKLKREYNVKVDEAKKKAYSKYISESENRVSAAWKLVKCETGKATQRKEVDSSLIAEELNNFFMDMCSCTSINPNQNDPTTLMQTSTANTISLGQTEESEIGRIIRNLKNKDTKDIYGISVRLLKKIEPVIAKQLCAVINKSLREGVFPNELKYAKVVPILKKGDPNDSSNYRPVSILPTMSKVFEVVVKDKIMKHLLDGKLLTEYQHGYVNQKSTTTALQSVVQKIVTGFDQQQYTQIIFCDLSKAFDSVSHEILNKKLPKYGLQGTAKQLLNSYMQQREQQVHWNGQISTWRKMERGVPQGSVLGPLLFLIYINDLPQNIPTQSICLYADDTSLINSGDVLEELKQKTNTTLQEAENWFNINQLQLNREKTNVLTCYTKRNENVTGKTAKFLGVTLTDTLTWTEHTSQLRRRLASSLYCLRVVTKNLTLSESRNVYFAYFHSVATYGLLVWGVSSDLESIFRLQKRAIRTLAGLAYRESCRTHFRRMGIQTLPACFIRACLEYAHNRRDTLQRNADLHSYRTRYGNEMLIPYHRINKSQNNFNYVSVKLYNALPTSVKQLNSIEFKIEIKRVLLEGEFYSQEEYFKEINRICTGSG